MSALSGYLMVFLGGGIGATLRYAVSRMTLLFGAGFPLATPLVNIVGSFLIGLLTGWFAFGDEASHQTLRLFLVTGLLGGFTTFSAFSLEAALLWERGKLVALLFYVATSVAASLVSVFVGLAMARAPMS